MALRSHLKGRADKNRNGHQLATQLDLLAQLDSNGGDRPRVCMWWLPQSPELRAVFLKLSVTEFKGSMCTGSKCVNEVSQCQGQVAAPLKR